MARKSALRCFIERDPLSRPLFLSISRARSAPQIGVFRPLWPSKPECDAHICLNLGFTSQNSRLSQVSLHVCYFWSSSFRMDEGGLLPSEQGPWYKGSSVRIKPPQLKLLLPEELPLIRQPSESSPNLSEVPKLPSFKVNPLVSSSWHCALGILMSDSMINIGLDVRIARMGPDNLGRCSRLVNGAVVNPSDMGLGFLRV
jgi:hypothetical protein